MSKLIKIFTASILISGLALPMGVLAQETPAAEAPAPAPESDAPSIIIVEPQSAPPQEQSAQEVLASPQNAASGQTASGSEALTETFNPNGALVDNSSVQSAGDPAPSDLPGQTLPPGNENASATPIETSTSTPPVIDLPNNPNPQAPVPAPVDPPAQDPMPSPQPPALELSQPAPDPALSIAVKKEKSKFGFRLLGGSIAAARNPDWKKRLADRKRAQSSQAGQPDSTDITNLPNAAPDAENGLNISGACADKYFVVLVYANSQDYNQNPSSYIYNKAFDCLNGQYFYSIKDLPETLQGGNYYLLIGGQGDVGSWKPITALLPINIQKQ